MEARKRYYTFGEAIDKLLADPEHLAITRPKYGEEGIVIVDLLPRADGVYPTKPQLVVVDRLGFSTEYIPSQEDIHSMNWMVLHKVFDTGKDEKCPDDLTEDEVSTSMSEATAKELTKVLKKFIQLTEKFF